jgi:anti-sigma factor RsiW
MSCHEYEIDLDDYIDASLPPDRVAAIDAHLAVCASCRALATDLRTLHNVAASLERRTPPPHVWARVSAALDAGQRRAPFWQALWHAMNPFAGWRPLLAGAIMLALITSATWFSWHQVSSVQSSAPVTAVVDPPPSAPVGQVEAAQALDTEIAHLEGIVNAGAEVLPGETKAAYQVNGDALEQAIGQNRAALQSDSTNNLAQQSLFEALRSKLALLQDMVALINEMRKGNQEGAARIVSGMEQ